MTTANDLMTAAPPPTELEILTSKEARPFIVSPISTDRARGCNLCGELIPMGRIYMSVDVGRKVRARVCASCLFLNPASP